MAPSKESQALAELFKIISASMPKDGNPFLQRAVYDQVHSVAAEAIGVSYETVTIAGRPAIWARPAGASLTHAMAFFHGGGYSFGSPNGHRKLMGHLAKACNIPTLSIDYRLTPEHSFPAPLDDCVSAYKYLLDLGIPPGNIVVAGDSCGGCLSTNVPLAARERGLPLPGASVSLSPQYEQTLGGGSMDFNSEKDVLGTREFMDMLGDRYTNGNRELRKDPLVSPLYADVTGLPPHWISCGGFDMLMDHGARMAEKLEKAGVEVVLEVHEGQQHVMEFMAGRAPEADTSIRKIGEWVRTKIGVQST